MERVLSIVDRYQTPITVVLVAAVLVGGGVTFARTYELRSLIAGQTTDDATVAELSKLRERQQTLLSELAKLREETDGLPDEAVSTTVESTSTSLATAADSSENGVVRLNSANQAALETLPGIGASKAQAILDYRTANGPFKSIDELDNVKGIGPSTVDKLRPHLTLD